MSASITRRAHTINAQIDTVSDSANNRKIYGTVTISDQRIGSEGWWLAVPKAEYNEKPVRLALISTGIGTFAYPDADGNMFNVDLVEHFALFNQWFKALSALSPSTPTVVAKNSETGEATENQWSTGPEPYLKVVNASEKRYYVIRPLLFKPVKSAESEKRQRRLLISIHNVFNVASAEDEDW